MNSVSITISDSLISWPNIMINNVVIWLSPIQHDSYFFENSTNIWILSSANEVWVGHRNAGCPSVCLSFRPSDLWMRYLKNRSTNRFQIWNMVSDHGKYGRYRFWAIYVKRDSSHRTFKIYAIDTPCESDIFKIVSPIDFRVDLWSHTNRFLNRLQTWIVFSYYQ